MEIKNRKSFNQLIKSLTEELIEDEDLEEITVTSDVDGYSTPFAFTGNKGKKKKKRISTNSTGYKVVKEQLDNKDITRIKVIIKDQVAEILRNIWLKRSSWK